MYSSDTGERSIPSSLKKSPVIYGGMNVCRGWGRLRRRFSGWRRLLVHTRDEMRFRFLALAAFALSALAINAYAWGPQGHQVIALLAEQQLTPKAKEQVQKLLALEPGETLASISTWADEHRNPTTAAWHYVNFPKNTCTYGVQRDCPDGDCVVEAINRQLAILASKAPDEKRLNALKYVVHLVADIHQPLHAGYGEDRGGNTYQLQAFKRSCAGATCTHSGTPD